MLTKKEIQFLKELTRQNIPFMMVGLSAAILQGSPVATQDVDLWFKNLNDPKIAEAIRKIGGSYVPPILEIQNPPRFVGEGIEFLDIVTGMSGLEEFEEEYKRAKTVVLEKLKIKILPLDRIIKSKKATGRQKDKIALPVLEAALQTIQDSEK